MPVAYISLVMPALAFKSAGLLHNGHFTDVTQVWLHDSHGAFTCNMNEDTALCGKRISATCHKFFVCLCVCVDPSERLIYQCVCALDFN